MWGSRTVSAPGTRVGSRQRVQQWNIRLGLPQTTGVFDQRGQTKTSIPTLPSGRLGQVHSMYAFGSVSLTVHENFHPPLV